MKRKLVTQTLFVGKSLLWSVLFYLAIMTMVNWEDVSTRKKEHTQHSFVKKNTQKELIPATVSTITNWFIW